MKSQKTGHFTAGNTDQFVTKIIIVRISILLIEHFRVVMFFGNFCLEEDFLSQS